MAQRSQARRCQLETAIEVWRKLEGNPEITYQFDIISGGAVSIDKDHLVNSKSRYPDRKTEISFQATCHRGDVVELVVREFLGPREHIAMLVEAGTGYGLTASDSRPPGRPTDLLSLPT